jgi:hypothetical protein
MRVFYYDGVVDDDGPGRLPALLARVAELEREKERLVDLVAAAESEDELDQMRQLARRYQARVKELTVRAEEARAHRVELRELFRARLRGDPLEKWRAVDALLRRVWERVRTRLEGKRGP